MESPESPAKSVAKRKRSKRSRPVLAAAAAAAAASSASSSSAEFSSGCTAAADDDDMAANCLILLAQGRCDSPHDDDDIEARPAESPPPPPLPLPLPLPPARKGGDRQNEKFGGSRRFTAGLYVYECKTCSKCFPSFQALGGHRASHKKPRLIAEEKKAVAAEETKDLQPFIPARHEIIQNYGTSSSNSNNNNNGNNKAAARVHECAICGAEFGSGQALGGHMRRHRPLSASAEAAESKKERGGGGAVLSLDLNLPAPADDVDGRVAAFAESQFQQQQQQQQQLLFSASALVDCHY